MYARQKTDPRPKMTFQDALETSRQRHVIISNPRTGQAYVNITLLAAILLTLFLPQMVSLVVVVAVVKRLRFDLTAPDKEKRHSLDEAMINLTIDGERYDAATERRMPQDSRRFTDDL